MMFICQWKQGQQPRLGKPHQTANLGSFLLWGLGRIREGLQVCCWIKLLADVLWHQSRLHLLLRKSNRSSKVGCRDQQPLPRAPSATLEALIKARTVAFWKLSIIHFSGKGLLIHRQLVTGCPPSCPAASPRRVAGGGCRALRLCEGTGMVKHEASLWGEFCFHPTLLSV